MTHTTATRGVLLIALGAPQYGQLAANLAASIRYRDATLPIHLVYTPDALRMLTPQHRALFTTMQLCPPECYTHQGTTEYIKAKTHLYELSPYEETLFIDVDVLLFPTTCLSDTMEALSAVCDFTIKNRGTVPDKNYTYWFDVAEAQQQLQIKGRFYQCQSEFIFFKRTRRNKRFFDKVRELYDTRPIAGTAFRNAAISDEYAYNLAMAVVGQHPHLDKYLPVYWYFLEPPAVWNSLPKQYLGFSLGGDVVPDWILQKVAAYNLLYKQSLKLPRSYAVGAKKKWA
jgi:hypothetical protein